MEQPADGSEDSAIAGESLGSNGDQERFVPANRLAGPSMPRRPELPVGRHPRPGFPWAAMLALFVVGGMCLLLALLSQGLLLPLGFVAGGMVIICGLHYVVWGWWLGAAIRREEEEDQVQT